jgi:clan AA aspartic protease
MISGSVNGRYEIIIPLRVLDSVGAEQPVDAILDTGFTGSLTLSPAAIANLGLEWRSRSSAVLASGRIVEFDIYAATVIWDGEPRQILVQAIENVPLMGMRMLARHDLRARVEVGGLVEIEPVP